MSASILIAEDDRVLAEIIRFNLSRSGYDVTVAFNGEAALEHGFSRRFDLIVTDYQMPKMTGVEFCRHLRTGKLNVTTPIIFCTAKGYEIDHKVLDEELCVERIFQKPFSPRELVSAIDELLESSTLPS